MNSPPSTATKPATPGNPVPGNTSSSAAISARPATTRAMSAHPARPVTAWAHRNTANSTAATPAPAPTPPALRSVISSSSATITSPQANTG
jgi:hypothetical protein